MFMKALQLLKHRALYAVLLSVVLSVALVAIVVSGATTISENVSTGGTLSVTGISTLTGAVNASSTVIATGRMQTFGQLVLQSATSDPSGPIAGALYYDSTNRVVKLYNGTSWFAVASSTNADGGLILTDNVGVRFNTIATGYMALGTTTLPVATSTLSTSALVSLFSTTTASVPLQIVAIAGQTSDLVQVFATDVNSAALKGHKEVFAIAADGSASTTVLSTTRRAVDALVISGYATTSGSTGNFATEGTLTVTGTQTFTGAMTANGAVTLGDAAGDSIIITGNASTTNSLSVRGLEFSVAGFATTTLDRTDTFATTTIGRTGEAGGGGALGVGTTTPTRGAKLGVVGDVAVSNTVGTTTLMLHTEEALFGTCIQMRASNGAMLRIYATSTSAAITSKGTFTPLIVEAGYCEKTLTSDVN